MVYNPVGPNLPPAQAGLESDYKRELKDRYGIEFNQLYTITNMPIHRFKEDLIRKKIYDDYMVKLDEAHNAANLSSVMCRDQLSISWDGYLYDCDFNQMLGMTIKDDQGIPMGVDDVDLNRLKSSPIAVGDHCYGCTAGAGSSCSGSL